MATRMQQKRGTAAEWASANPVLAEGELGYEKDTGIIKLGNGFSTWNTLSPIFGNAYLLASGTAANSEKLDGVDGTGYVRKIEASTAATNNTYALRTATGTLAGSPGSKPNEFITYGQASTYGRDRGAGTTFPSTDLRRGDTFYSSTWNGLFIFNGSAWYQAHVFTVMSNAARSASGTAALYPGFKVWHSGLGVEQIWDGSGWRFTLAGAATVQTDANGLALVSHGAGQAPKFRPIVSIGNSGSDAQNMVLKWLGLNESTSTQLWFMAVRTDTITRFPNPSLGLTWSCNF